MAAARRRTGRPATVRLCSKFPSGGSGACTSASAGSDALPRSVVISLCTPPRYAKDELPQLLGRIVELEPARHMNDGRVILAAFQPRKLHGRLPRQEHAGLGTGALANDPQTARVLAEQ